MDDERGDGTQAAEMTEVERESEVLQSKTMTIPYRIVSNSYRVVAYIVDLFGGC